MKYFLLEQRTDVSQWKQNIEQNRYTVDSR